MRPTSIIWFERLFLAAIGLGAINSAVSFKAIEEMTGGQAGGTSLLIVSIGFSIGIYLLFWYWIARCASNVAKWLLTVLVILSIASVAFSIAVGSYPGGFAGILGAIVWLMHLASVLCLFRPDATAWFRGVDDGDLSETFE